MQQKRKRRKQVTLDYKEILMLKKERLQLQNVFEFALLIAILSTELETFPPT
jgi:hypothetical protein